MSQPKKGLSKKAIVGIVILAIVLGYLVLYRLVPSWGAVIDAAVGPTVAGLGAGIYNGITTNPIWIAYDIYFTLVVGFAIASLVWWKGRDVTDSIRGIARVRATETGPNIAFQTGPSASPTVIPAQVSTVTPQPVVPVEQKKETSS